MDVPGPRQFSRRLLGVLLLILACACGRFADADNLEPAQQRAANVAQVVMGILSYARWPVEPQQLRLCVIGPTEYADNLLKGTIQPSGRPVVVRRLLAGDNRIATECDALYIGTLGASERADLFAAISGHPVLSISEESDQCTVGSVFCLHISDTQVGFEVNLDSVARSGVRIHPSVLQLSRRKAVTP